MTKKLWEASLNRKKNSTLFAFENYISKKFNKNFNNKFEKLLDWTIKNSPDFWSSFWDFSKIKGTKSSKTIKKSKFRRRLRKKLLENPDKNKEKPTKK
mgnify:CR=1 FL=1